MTFTELLKPATLPRTRIFSKKTPIVDGERRKDSLKLEKGSRLCRKDRRGAAAVEFAIIAPVFFLLILGMIEIGRGVMVQQIITNASREGARLAVLPGTTSQEVEDRVISILEETLKSGGPIPGATVEILGENGSAINPQDAAYGEVIKVEVSVPWSSISWTGGFHGYEKDTNSLTYEKHSGAKLTASTSMRGERVQ